MGLVVMEDAPIQGGRRQPWRQCQGSIIVAQGGGGFPGGGVRQRPIVIDLGRIRAPALWRR